MNSVVVKEGHATHTLTIVESVPRHDVKAKRHTVTTVNSREDVVDDRVGCVTKNGAQPDIEPVSPSGTCSGFSLQAMWRVVLWLSALLVGHEGL